MEGAWEGEEGVGQKQCADCNLSRYGMWDVRVKGLFYYLGHQDASGRGNTSSMMIAVCSCARGYAQTLLIVHASLHRHAHFHN